MFCQHRHILFEPKKVPIGRWELSFPEETGIFIYRSKDIPKGNKLKYSL